VMAELGFSDERQLQGSHDRLTAALRRTDTKCWRGTSDERPSRPGRRDLRVVPLGAATRAESGHDVVMAPMQFLYLTG